MSKAKSVNGHDLMLWLDGKVIAGSKSCKINMTAATVDSETKDDGTWDAKEIGSRGYTINNESVYSIDKNRAIDLVYRDLFKAYISDEPIEASWGIPSNASAEGLPEDGWQMPTGDYLKGKVLITGLDFDGTKGSKGSISISLQGYGKLEYIEPTV
jgi:predicted secreted protein